MEGGRKVKRKQRFYNLDVIISVGYRIQSHVATRFRQWATQHIKDYIVKGFVLDDERLKIQTNLPIILKNCSNAFRTLELERRFTKRLPTSMQPVLIMTPH